MKNPVTMRDVAAHCRCSQPTVSLCLNNSPRIPAATRARVLAAAAQLGYRKHPLVAAHMRSRRKRSPDAAAPVLALVNPQPAAEGWRKSTAAVLRQMFAGATARALERGYSPQEFWLHEEDMSHQRFSDILRARGISGLLVGPCSHLELDLALAWDAFSCVQLGSGHIRPTLHRVVNDHYQSATLVVRECHALGYRRPGLVLPSALSLRHDRRWEAGFQIACQQLAGLEPVPILLLDSINDHAALLQWFERFRPDVVIEATERMMLRHLEAAGYRVPRDVGVATLGAPRLRGPASGAVQDGHLLGSNAVDLLISLVERNETGVPARPFTQMTASLWNPGETVHDRTRPTRGAPRP